MSGRGKSTSVADGTVSMGAAGSTLSGDEFEAWERRLALLGLTAVLAATAWLLVLRTDRSSIMLEYVTKFVPHFAEGGIAKIFDVDGLGDPRLRLADNLLSWLNVSIRAWLLRSLAIPPSLSLTWLMHPACLVVLFAAVRRLPGAGLRAAAMATILYAASPALLESLNDLLIPAKALVSLCFIVALYGATWLIDVPELGTEARPGRAASIIGAALTLALLSDETAIFIPICLPILLAGIGRMPAGGRTRALLFSGAALAIPFAVVAVLGLLVVPLLNAALDQVPLDLITTVTKSPYAEMFGENRSEIANRLTSAAPFGLLETILSVHVVPGRIVNIQWTANQPLKWFFQWTAREQLSLALFLMAGVLAFRNLPPPGRTLARNVLLAAIPFVLIESVLLLPLATHLSEVCYYASLSSVFLALFAGTAFGGMRLAKPLGWALVLYLAAVQMSNYMATAIRHPFFGTGAFDWHAVESIRNDVVARGPAALKNFPFFSRQFFYGFEVAAALASARGAPVDLRPLAREQDGLYKYIDIAKMADPAVTGGDLSAPAREAQIGALGAQAVDPSSVAELLAWRRVQGEAGDWSFRWRVGGRGEVVARAWHRGLLRVWGDRGSLTAGGGRLCVRFTAWGDFCLARLYRKDSELYGYSERGDPIATFHIGERLQ